VQAGSWTRTESEDEQEAQDDGIDQDTDKDVGRAKEEHGDATCQLAACVRTGYAAGPAAPVSVR
jgi:hypothetical protein